MPNNQPARHAEVCGPWQILWPHGSFGGSGEPPADQIQVEICTGLSCRVANRLSVGRPRPGFTAKSSQSAKNSPSCRPRPEAFGCAALRSGLQQRSRQAACVGPGWLLHHLQVTQGEFDNRSRTYSSLECHLNSWLRSAQGVTARMIVKRSQGFCLFNPDRSVYRNLSVRVGISLDCLVRPGCPGGHFSRHTHRCYDCSS